MAPYNRLPPHSELWEYACEIGAEGWSERFKGDPAAKAPQLNPCICK